MNWTLVGHRATANWGETVAVVDTLDLRSGLSIPSGPWQGSNIGTLPNMLPTNNPASVESYVRGSDLVTTHPATTERPTRVQLYWRRWDDLPAKITAVVELVASVQTHLLDSDSTLVIESRLTKCSQTQLTVDSIDLNLGTCHLQILPHPQDDTEVDLQSSDTGTVARHTLFRSRLEKGVILRGRLLFVWSDQEVDVEALQKCADRFYSSEPMLTA